MNLQSHKKLVVIYKDFWKKKIFKMLLTSIGYKGIIEFKRFKKNIDFDDSNLYIMWGINSYAHKNSKKFIITIEDGFLRSAGYGANLTLPKSLIIDQLGNHYNWRDQSDLEIKLNSYNLLNHEKNKSKELLNIICSNNLTKYGAFQEKKSDLALDILVVGQNNNDAALAAGSEEISTNLLLAKKVRKLNPDRHITFLDHPDNSILGNKIDKKILTYVDNILDKDIEGIHAICKACEVHVISSLLGFEALLRNKKVYVYGFPFYWGWGLTEDIYYNKELQNRRTKRLSIEELLWIAYAKYPIYINKNGKKSDVFEIAKEIIDESNLHKSPIHIFIREKILRFLIRVENLLLS